MNASEEGTDRETKQESQKKEKINQSKMRRSKIDNYSLTVISQDGG